VNTETSNKFRIELLDYFWNVKFYLSEIVCLHGEGMVRKVLIKYEEMFVKIISQCSIKEELSEKNAQY
jgi:hypothetical protein